MKTLSQYIIEAMGEEALRELTVKYNAPDEVFVQVPEKMSESDVQIYLDDTLLSNMPAEKDPKALGKNVREISDAYFEYEMMEATNGASQKADIVWDDHYDQSMNGINMHVLKITGLKYVIAFDKFYLEDVDLTNEEEVRDLLFDLFNGLTEEDGLVPFELVLNKENITWK